MKISEMNTEQYVYLCEKITEFVRTFPSDQRAWGFPTIRLIAKKFSVPQKEIITVCEDVDELDYDIGIRTHNGIYEFPVIGDYLVEYIGEEDER